MDISVIISTWNNCRRLAITLQSLRQCAVPEGVKWELVIVNNNCTDETDTLINKFKSHLPIVHVHEPTQGLSRAKNKGLKAARGQLAIFTDDDVKPCPEWITAYWENRRQHAHKTFFGGPVESEFEISPDERLIKLAPYSVKGFDLGGAPGNVNGKNFISANWACEKQALLEIGGFDVTRGLNPASKKLITGEEVDLMRRLRYLGWRARYVPDARIKHYVPANKCTVAHIAARVEAFAADKVVASCNGHIRSVMSQIPMIASTVTRSIGRIGLDRIAGKKISTGYVQWRRGVGYMKGLKICLAGKN